MYCPKCRAEYALGITRCVDCDVELVEVLPDARPGRRDLTDHLVTVLSTHDPGLAAVAECCCSRPTSASRSAAWCFRTLVPCPSSCRSWPATPMRHYVSWPSSLRLTPTVVVGAV